MSRKIICSLLSLLLCFSFSYVAYADSNLEVCAIFANKPELIFETRNQIPKKDNFENIKIDDDFATIDSIDKFDFDNFSVCCYTLVDVSGSMSQSEIDSIKPSLYAFSKNFDDNDSFVLNTFDETQNSLLKGTEDDSLRKEKINSIDVSNKNSSLYKALNDILSEANSNSDFDRKLVLIITDADNWSNETSFSTVNQNFSKKSLPIYSMISNSELSQRSNNNVSEFKDLVDNSGGKYYVFDSNNATQKFENIIDDICNVSIVKCISESNIIDASVSDHKFVFTYDNINYSYSVCLSQHQKDDTFPEVTSISYQDDKFVIEFTEPIICDSERIAIKKGKKEIAIYSVKYKDNKIYISTKDDIYSGKYKFIFDGVTDNSTEKNELRDKEITQRVKANSLVLRFVKTVWWVIPILVCIVALILILFFLKKKKKVKTVKELFETQIEEEVVEKKYTQVIKEKNVVSLPNFSKNVTLFVENDNANKKLNICITSSLIVGRSQQCDLVINDKKMSRQHFAIEIEKDKLNVMDLNTTNGTFVNGIKVNGKCVLNSHDKITAGTSSVTIVY